MILYYTISFPVKIKKNYIAVKANSWKLYSANKNTVYNYTNVSMM